MKQYRIKAYGDYERRQKPKEAIITAKDENEAWVKAWMTFPEYKELHVTEVGQDG